jgi:hypothetical protein
MYSFLFNVEGCTRSSFNDTVASGILITISPNFARRTHCAVYPVCILTFARTPGNNMWQQTDRGRLAVYDIPRIFVGLLYMGDGGCRRTAQC